MRDLKTQIVQDKVEQMDSTGLYKAGRLNLKPLAAVFIVFLSFSLHLSGCSLASKTLAPTETETPAPVQDTETPQPEATSTETATPTLDLEPLPDITLCEDEWEGEYCIHALGFSSDRQVISLRHTDNAQVEVLLIINDEKYACQTVQDYPGNLYCIGPQISIFKDARVVIVTLVGEEPLAGGVLDLPYLVREPTKPADGPGYY